MMNIDEDINVNSSLDFQIKEAKLRAELFSKSLREAREQEASALKTLEEERKKWTKAFEEKTIMIEQLERELSSTVEALDVSKKSFDSDNLRSSQSLLSNDFKILTDEEIDDKYFNADYKYNLDISANDQTKPKNKEKEYSFSKEEKTELNNESLIWNDLINQYKIRLSESNDNLDKSYKENQESHKKISELKSQLNFVLKEKEELKIAFDDMEAKYKFRAQQISEYEDEKFRFTKEKSQLKQQVEILESRIRSLQNELSVSNAEIEMLLNQNKLLEKKYAEKKNLSELEANASSVFAVDPNERFKYYEDVIKELREKKENIEEEYKNELANAWKISNDLQRRVEELEFERQNKILSSEASINLNKSQNTLDEDLSQIGQQVQKTVQLNQRALNTLETLENTKSNQFTNNSDSHHIDANQSDLFNSSLDYHDDKSKEVSKTPHESLKEEAVTTDHQPSTSISPLAHNSTGNDHFKGHQNSHSNYSFHNFENEDSNQEEIESESDSVYSSSSSNNSSVNSDTVTGDLLNVSNVSHSYPGQYETNEPSKHLKAASEVSKLRKSSNDLKINSDSINSMEWKILKKESSQKEKENLNKHNKYHEQVQRIIKKSSTLKKSEHGPTKPIIKLTRSSSQPAPKTKPSGILNLAESERTSSSRQKKSTGNQTSKATMKKESRGKETLSFQKPLKEDRSILGKTRAGVDNSRNHKMRNSLEKSKIQPKLQEKNKSIGSKERMRNNDKGEHKAQESQQSNKSTKISSLGKEKEIKYSELYSNSPKTPVYMDNTEHPKNYEYPLEQSDYELNESLGLSQESVKGIKSIKITNQKKYYSQDFLEYLGTSNPSKRYHNNSDTNNHDNDLESIKSGKSLATLSTKGSSKKSLKAPKANYGRVTKNIKKTDVLKEPNRTINKKSTQPKVKAPVHSIHSKSVPTLSIGGTKSKTLQYSSSRVAPKKTK